MTDPHTLSEDRSTGPLRFAAPAWYRHRANPVLCFLVLCFLMLPLTAQSAGGGTTGGRAGGAAAASPSAPKASPVPADKALNAQLATLLQRLDTMIRSSGKDDEVSKTWSVIRNLMVKSKLLFTIGPASGGDLIAHGAVFEAPASGPGRIILARDLMELIPRNDVLVMSMVMNALVFAEAHAQDPEGYQESREDILQGYLYSMDALYVQCLFCRDYAGAFPGIEGGYTGFLAGGLKLDGLSTVAMYVLSVDQVLVSAFLDLDSRLNSGMAAGVWYDRVENLFKDVDDHLAQSAGAGIPRSDGTQVFSLEDQKSMAYIAAVGALTLVRFAPGIINSQLERHPALQAKEFESRRAGMAARIEGLGPRLKDLAAIARPWREEFLTKLLPRQ